MPKYILYLFFMLQLFTVENLLLPKPASAAVKVNISNSGGDNSVSVKSNTGSNYQSTNSVNSTTDITINNNGEVKEYHGSDSDIEMKSNDGKSTVSVKNNGTANNPSPTSSSKVTSKTNITINSNTDNSSPSATPEATVAGIFKDNSEVKTNTGFWAYFKSEMAKIFSFFK